ncbi:AMP-dependent synthetase [Alsobacter metallidurans]|uniref:3-methylmercaptopropionyl-CoA ligase n=1 Tax=Alsobacter metallidurans TaxID=340221 RepID=A0A917MJN8_9HYPH|nr:AMP-binding protein [Alsobacter metallidurans]GGH28004.1 AMP-dependent synthetase [Alsobacter metallidurans]
MNLAAMIRDVARRQPDAPAVTDGAVTHSYAAFVDRAARIGGALRERGLAPGDRVVLAMENCGEFLELLVACWTAGLCVVPVNAKLHPREVEHIVRDSGARAAFTTPGLADGLTPLVSQVETLETLVCTRTPDYARLLGCDPCAVHPGGAEERAWIFYTSGTTGRPKGAILSHRNLLFMSYSYYADIDALDARDVKLHTAPLSHASGLFALPHLLRGGHQVVLPGFDIEAIADALLRYSNVTMWAAPTMLTRLVHSPLASSLRTESIKTIYYGGGPMYVADLRRALAIFGPRLYQIYGQGESPMTIAGLAKTMHDAPDDLRTCGVARTGVLVRVVNDRDEDVPPGEIGEVVTRSDCMMQGYWNNPTASAEALRGGWLHTGDLGSMDERGFLTLRDRSKDMIISGGSNIYPREIEEVLLRHPGVLEVSVVGRPHPDWGEEVVAFVVAKPSESVDPAALDALCLDNIARFKRPKSYEFVEALPKNNYGKVLKTELRDRMKT